MKRSVIYYIRKIPKFVSLKLLYAFSGILPDRLYLSILYRLEMGYWMNFKNPITFSEKLQWLKLYNRKPEYSSMVDKYAAKEYVQSRIGSEFIIPTLGVWDNPEDIEWDCLPDQFVLKTTHSGGSTGVVICRDKRHFDKEKASKALKKSLDTDTFRYTREWPYKNVRRRIIAEKYIAPPSGTNDLPDYKFFCFDGDVKALFVATERQNPNEDVKFDFFDSEFNHLPFRQGHQNAKVMPHKPLQFERMKMAASALSKGIPHVRVDLYENGNSVLFGEMTFFHFSGLEPIIPKEWDKTFGDMITLPDKSI